MRTGSARDSSRPIAFQFPTESQPWAPRHVTCIELRAIYIFRIPSGQSLQHPLGTALAARAAAQPRKARTRTYCGGKVGAKGQRGSDIWSEGIRNMKPRSSMVEIRSEIERLWTRKESRVKSVRMVYFPTESGTSCVRKRWRPSWKAAVPCTARSWCPKPAQGWVDQSTSRIGVKNLGAFCCTSQWRGIVAVYRFLSSAHFHLQREFESTRRWKP